MTWGKNAGVLRWVLVGLAFFATLWGGVRLTLDGANVVLYAAAMFFLAAVSLFLGVWGWVLRIPKYTAAQKRLWGAPSLEKTIVFYDDHFEQVSRLGTLRFSYERVTQVKTHGRSLLLLMGQNAMLMQRDGFDKTDEAAFLAFLAKKRAGAAQNKAP
jgi:hypothetical protein